jgi:hypothetical protein
MESRLIVKLEETPSQKILYISTGISAVLTIIIFVLMRPVETALKSLSPYGVMELEFAWTVEKINTIFTTWEQADSSLISQELFVTLIDYGFLLAYSTFFACITLLISRKLLSGRIQLVGFYMTIFSFIAAVFDAIENINLILMLSSPSSFPSFSPLLASVFALLKFSLLILVICFWIISAAWLVKKWVSK